jgi:hypothetical protein
LRIQPTMETPLTPPEKRKGCPGALLVLIIVGVIVGGIVLFIVFHPNPRNSSNEHSTPQSTGISRSLPGMSPSAKNKVEKGVLL